jgi:hypothetical protein
VGDIDPECLADIIGMRTPAVESATGAVALGLEE